MEILTLCFMFLLHFGLCLIFNATFCGSIALYRACDATSVHDRATKLLFVLPKVVNGP